jgi:hypothetical protein
MDDDIFARDRTFAVNSGKEEVEAGETHDSEIDDDPGLDLEWPLDEEPTEADVFWRSAREGLIEVMNQDGVRPEERGNCRHVRTVRHWSIAAPWFQPNSWLEPIRIAFTSQRPSVAFHRRSG